MQPVYTLPCGDYFVTKQNDELWQEVFGEKAVPYLVCRYDEKLQEWNRKNPQSRLTDYYIVHSFGELDECFSWFLRMGLISKEEFIYQIEQLRKLKKA